MGMDIKVFSTDKKFGKSFEPCIYLEIRNSDKSSNFVGDLFHSGKGTFIESNDVQLYSKDYTFDGYMFDKNYLSEHTKGVIATIKDPECTEFYNVLLNFINGAKGKYIIISEF